MVRWVRCAWAAMLLVGCAAPRAIERTPALPIPTLAADAARSPELRNAALRSPMPGGWVGGWAGDTGLDVAGRRLAVYAIASGTLDYSERGHTLWTSGRDTPNSVRIALDAPIPWRGHRITHVYYTHLSSLETVQAEGAAARKHVVAGERIGVSGIGNGVPHLHLGLLLDGQVEQDSWTFILREDEVRKVLGGYKNGERLPAGHTLAGTRDERACEPAPPCSSSSSSPVRAAWANVPSRSRPSRSRSAARSGSGSRRRTRRARWPSTRRTAGRRPSASSASSGRASRAGSARALTARR